MATSWAPMLLLLASLQAVPAPTSVDQHASAGDVILAAPIARRST